MNVKEYTTEISARLALRSFFIYAFSVSLLLNVILAVGLTALDKEDRVVVLPAEITKSFWLDADSVSPEYLEQMGLESFCTSATRIFSKHTVRCLGGT